VEAHTIDGNQVVHSIPGVIEVDHAAFGAQAANFEFQTMGSRTRGPGEQLRRQQQQRSWWRTAPNPTVDRDAALERLHCAHYAVRRQEQNRWLGKHAKRRRFEFSAEQKRMLKQWFNALDSDGSGKISVEVRTAWCHT
jgi:hypothetical protein